MERGSDQPWEGAGVGRSLAGVGDSDELMAKSQSRLGFFVAGDLIVFPPPLVLAGSGIPLSLESSLYIFRYKSSVVCMIYKYFLPVCSLSFHALDNVFCRANLV